MSQYYHFKNRAIKHSRQQTPCPTLSAFFELMSGNARSNAACARICYSGSENRTCMKGCYACAAGAAFGLGGSFFPGARIACRIVPSMRGINSTMPASPMSWMSLLMIL